MIRKDYFQFITWFCSTTKGTKYFPVLHLLVIRKIQAKSVMGLYTKYDLLYILD